MFSLFLLKCWLQKKKKKDGNIRAYITHPVSTCEKGVGFFLSQLLNFWQVLRTYMKERIYMLVGALSTAHRNK
jgi:hypothetical protein